MVLSQMPLMRRHGVSHVRLSVSWTRKRSAPALLPPNARQPSSPTLSMQRQASVQQQRRLAPRVMRCRVDTARRDAHRVNAPLPNLDLGKERNHLQHLGMAAQQNMASKTGNRLLLDVMCIAIALRYHAATAKRDALPPPRNAKLSKDMTGQDTRVNTGKAPRMTVLLEMLVMSHLRAILTHLVTILSD